MRLISYAVWGLQVVLDEMGVAMSVTVVVSGVMDELKVGVGAVVLGEMGVVVLGVVGERKMCVGAVGLGEMGVAMSVTVVVLGVVGERKMGVGAVGLGGMGVVGEEEAVEGNRLP